MMSKNLLKALVVVVCIAGCAGVMKERVISSGVANLDNKPAEVGVSKVAVFPFADYSHQQDALQSELWGGNIKILEEVTDYFVAKGISIAIQEDVNSLLVDNQIIKPIASQQLIYGSGDAETPEMRSRIIGTPEYDLVNVEHSEEMKEAIIDVIRDEMSLEHAQNPSVKTPVLQGATVGLSKEMVQYLGEELEADIIIRGRIIEYGLKAVDTYNPLKRGFLPVLYEPVKDALFGAPSGKEYETGLDPVDYSQLGQGLGFLLGQKTQDDVVGTWDVLMENSFGTIANLYPRKKQVSSIVQIRMYAQDVKTGDVIWSNRVETEYTPRSNQAFNSKHVKTMFDKNIERGIAVLMDDMFSCITLKAQERKEDEGTTLSELDRIREAGVAGEAGVAISPEQEALIQELREEIERLEGGESIVLQIDRDKTLINLPDAILFPSGTDMLTRQGIDTLNTINTVLEGYPNRPICVEGHTDNVPIGPTILDKYATNWELSTARAIRVMNYMAEHLKLEESMMAVKGFGPYKPVADNDTPDGRSQNRRVIILISPENNSNT
jgi:flagellar motor protein MotB